jgi:hypothetical protein
MIIVPRECTRQRAGLDPAPVRVAPAEFGQVTDPARQRSTDYVLIETRRRKLVQVTAGPARTTPVCLACRDGILAWGLTPASPSATR